MLVITRKAGEAIRIGDDVTITVLDVAGSTVRIGIDAPSEIPVFRQEIWAAVKEENRAAADASANSTPSMIAAAPALLLFMWTLLPMERACRGFTRSTNEQAAGHA